MYSIPAGLAPELVPLSWLVGVWEGRGVIDYTVGEDRVLSEFGQRISFSHDGLPYLNYSSHAWLLGETGDAGAAAPGSGKAEPLGPLVGETGYWRISRAQTAADVGPGMLPPTAPSTLTTAEAVESLRSGPDRFPLEVSIVHPTGVSELYLGSVAGARIDISTDYVMRTAGSKAYSAATRMYGLVEGDLLWAWDVAALGQPLATHASARLSRAD